MPNMRTTISLALLLALTVCEGFTDYAYIAIEKKKQYSDTEAAVFSQGPCAMTVGAYFRNFSAAKRQAIAQLCGGEDATLPILDPETGLLVMPQ